MNRRQQISVGAAFALLAALAAAAPAADKPKRERAQVALPVIVELPDGTSSVHSFREGEFWGWQGARYRSAVTLSAPVALPGLWDGAVIPADQPLIELQASSRAFSGSLYCTAQQPNPKLTGTLLCLADRDGDGALDQLWTGGAASMKYLVPFPRVRSVRTIAPVRATRIEDPARLALQLRFYVSGTNPIFGTHHFYPMLSSNGELGFPLPR